MAGHHSRSLSALCAASRSGRATCESLQRVSPTVTISATSATARLPSRRCKSERGHHDDHRRFKVTRTVSSGSGTCDDGGCSRLAIREGSRTSWGRPQERSKQQQARWRQAHPSGTKSAAEDDESCTPAGALDEDRAMSRSSFFTEKEPGNLGGGT